MRRLFRFALAVLLVLAAAGLARELTTSPATGQGDRPRLDLHPWSMLGCYRVRVEPWSVAPAAGGRAGSRDPGGTGSARDPAGTGPPESFRPPETVVLLPDSVDRWGRSLPTRRAVRLTGDGRPGRRLRWFVHADTLWLLWSEADSRAGIALRSSGDSLVGRARALGRQDSVDATARAAAWPVNCWTLGREGGGEVPRR